MRNNVLKAFSQVGTNFLGISRFCSGYIYENLRDTSEPKCLVKNNASGKCKGKGPHLHSDGISRKTSTGPVFEANERFDPSKPFHAGPLKLDIKSIKNSTRVESTGIAINSFENEESGRSLITAGVLLLWFGIWKWKATITFLIVHTIDFIWTSIKNILGWGNEHYETTINIGSEHPPHHKGHGWRDGHHHGHYGHEGHHGVKGWKPYRTRDPWFHPATKLFEQPTYQYLPYGGEYTLLGFDQNQAYKYRRKYKQKFDAFRRKYYRKKGKEIIKAQKARDREKKKAERRKVKAARRKHKLQLFQERVKDWQEFWDGLQGNKGDDDDDEHDEVHDDKVDSGKTKTKQTKKKGEKGDAKKEKIQGDKNDLKPKTKEERNRKKSKEKGDGEDIEEAEDDLPYNDDKLLDEPSFDIEHGGPPLHKPVSPTYHPDKDYDPLPSMTKNQKYIRIRLRR